jgi:hypothetical protein
VGRDQGTEVLREKRRSPESKGLPSACTLRAVLQIILPCYS